MSYNFPETGKLISNGQHLTLSYTLASVTCRNPENLPVIVQKVIVLGEGHDDVSPSAFRHESRLCGLGSTPEPAYHQVHDTYWQCLVMYVYIDHGRK